MKDRLEEEGELPDDWEEMDRGEKNAWIMRKMEEEFGQAVLEGIEKGMEAREEEE